MLCQYGSLYPHWLLGAVFIAYTSVRPQRAANSGGQAGEGHRDHPEDVLKKSVNRHGLISNILLVERRSIMTPSFAKSNSGFCLLQNLNSLHLLLHLHAFHYIYLQIPYLFTWCLSLLRSDCNHTGGLLQASASIAILLSSYTNKCSLVIPALISFKSSKFPSVLGWLGVGQGSVSHGSSRHESDSFCPAVFYCNIRHLPHFRLRESVLLLEVGGWKSGQIVCQGHPRTAVPFAICCFNFLTSLVQLG